MAEIRAFIAIEIDPAIITRLTALQQQWRCAEAPVTWSRPEGLHLTLKFLGNVPEERLPSITETLARIAHAHFPFVLRVEGVGGFPTLKRPRVLWAGIGEGSAPATMLAREIETALEALGFPRESRPFNPHLTLGRVKAPDGLARLLALMTPLIDAPFGEMQAQAVSLMRSELSPHGAKYTELYRASLGENAAENAAEREDA